VGDIRLFIDTALGEAEAVELSRDHAHYLFNVMRLGPGDTLLAFNGRAGEWRMQVVEAAKKRGVLKAVEQTRTQTTPPDIELLFAPIKKARTDFIVEKACELGCARVQPVFTRFTNSERLNPERLRAHMIEAAEQCGGLTVPDLAEPTKLSVILDQWRERALVFCDEARTALPAAQALANLKPGTPVSILIGPEGGFSAEEKNRIAAMAGAVPVSLGPRVLRADTAAVAAITLVQSALGDWGGTAG
jgi:16S rRNA (uracil1498-N3)-methyltransferase